MNDTYFVRKIVQKDRFTFTIEWMDGKVGDYRLSDLQMHCPCARCRDEKTGRSLLDLATLNREVTALRIESLGCYALRVLFTSGCSKGIYTFSFLRRMAHL